MYHCLGIPSSAPLPHKKLPRIKRIWANTRRFDIWNILTQKLQQPRGEQQQPLLFFGKQTSKQELGSRKKGVSTRVFLKTRTMNAKPGEEDSIRGLLILLQKEKVVICPQCRLLSAAFGILQQHGAQHTCAL